MMCAFAQNSNSSPTAKIKNKKKSEQILENNKDQFSISPNGIFKDVIKGIVYDAKTKEPLIGANVIEYGTANAAVTDIDGQKILVASYVGYVTQTKKIGGLEVVNFFLEEYQQTLDK